MLDQNLGQAEHVAVASILRMNELWESEGVYVVVIGTGVENAADDSRRSARDATAGDEAPKYLPRRGCHRHGQHDTRCDADSP